MTQRPLRPIDVVLSIAAQRGWSRSELARRLGESAQTITNWSKRGLPPAKYAHVAAQLGFSIDAMLSDQAGKASTTSQNSPIAAAIKREAGQDGMRLIEDGLRALVIVGRRKDEIMRIVQEAREEADQYRIAVLEELKAKT